LTSGLRARFGFLSLFLCALVDFNVAPAHVLTILFNSFGTVLSSLELHIRFTSGSTRGSLHMENAFFTPSDSQTLEEVENVLIRCLPGKAS
jgi:hypothetical protein